MTSKRVFFAMLIVVALMITGLLVGTYGTYRLMEQRSSHIVSERSDLAAFNEEETELATSKSEINRYQALSAITAQIVPQDKDQAETVRQIVDLASENGVSLASVTFPASTLGAGANGTTVGSPSLSQLTAVKGIPGVYGLQVTVNSNPSVPYQNFLNFLQGLEQNRRTALVQSVSLEPDPTTLNAVSFTLVLEEYIKP